MNRINQYVIILPFNHLDSVNTYGSVIQSIRITVWKGLCSLKLHDDLLQEENHGKSHHLCFNFWRRSYLASSIYYSTQPVGSKSWGLAVVMFIKGRAIPDSAFYDSLSRYLTSAGWWRDITIIVPNSVMWISIQPTAVNDLQVAERFTPFVFN